MSSLNAAYTIVNLQNDSVQLAGGLRTALTSSDAAKVNEAWRETITNLGKLINGLNDLAGRNPTVNRLLGTTSNLAAMVDAYNAIEQDYTGNNNSLSSIKAKDILSFTGNLADLAGNFLLKPGPTLVPGLVLKGLGTGAGLAQNAVGEQTIGQLLDFGAAANPVARPIIATASLPPLPTVQFAPDGVTPLFVQQSNRQGNNQIDGIWVQLGDGSYQNVQTITTLRSDGTVVSSSTFSYSYSSEGVPLHGSAVTRDAIGNVVSTSALTPSSDEQTWNNASIAIPDTTGLGTPARQSSAYISPVNIHAVQFNAGGGVDDLWIVARDAGRYVGSRDQFRADFAVSNPDVNPASLLVQQNVNYYLPERKANSDTTYHYANGGTISNNTGTNEYYMVVPNTDGQGGQTIYSRTADDFGYTIKQTSTNAAGATTYSYQGYQETLGAAVNRTRIDNYAPNTPGQLDSRITTQTDDDGNTLEISTLADGSGTARALDPDGAVINQFAFQRTNDAGAGAIDGDNGTITTTVNGRPAVFAADFGYSEDEGTTVELTGLT